MRRRGWALVSGVTFVGYLLLHLPTSDVFDGFARRFGFSTYDTTTRAVFVVGGVLLWGWLWRAPADVRAAIRPPLLVLTVVLAYALGMLAVNGIEAIHLPQYVLLVLLLIPAGLGVESAWALATVLGAVDEIWQWQLLRRARPEYFDWNDVVLNAIGAALGVLVAVRRRRNPAGRAVARGEAVGLLAAALGLSLWAGPIVAEPFYRFSPAGRWFHLATAFEGVLLIAAVWWSVRQAATRWSAADAAAPAGEVQDALRDGLDPRRD